MCIRDRAISMEDLFGGASSDSDGTLSVKSDTCQPCHKLLTPVAYAALPDTTVPRDQWIPGYRDRVPRSTPAVAPWSARRVNLICVADLDLDDLYRHFSKPTGFIFPARSAKISDPPVTQWSSSLITMAKIQDLYSQKPWKIYDHPVQPLSLIHI